MRRIDFEVLTVVLFKRAVEPDQTVALAVQTDGFLIHADILESLPDLAIAFNGLGCQVNRLGQDELLHLRHRNLQVLDVHLDADILGCHARGQELDVEAVDYRGLLFEAPLAILEHLVERFYCFFVAADCHVVGLGELVSATRMWLSEAPTDGVDFGVGLEDRVFLGRDSSMICDHTYII